jgi:hypothetical protein
LAGADLPAAGFFPADSAGALFAGLAPGLVDFVASGAGAAFAGLADFADCFEEGCFEGFAGAAALVLAVVVVKDCVFLLLAGLASEAAAVVVEVFLDGAEADFLSGAFGLGALDFFADAAPADPVFLGADEPLVFFATATSSSQAAPGVRPGGEVL